MSEYNKNRKPTPRGSYIPVALNRHFLNGDAYIKLDEAYQICCGKNQSYSTFEADLAEQIRLGKVYREGTRLYLAKTWRYEESAAKDLRRLLDLPSLPACTLPETVMVGSIALCAEQRAAVAMALSNRISIILGGAGSGKSTLVQAIDQHLHSPVGKVYCAPTGKAARNLAKRTGLEVRTVHSALGMIPNEDFLAPVDWMFTRLVVVDEASMMTLEMLAGIINRMTSSCHIVLIGDKKQLLSVGSGNVLLDLLKLKVPYIQLQTNHRQDTDAVAMLHNVVNFASLVRARELAFDNSFQLRELGDQQVQSALVNEATQRYLAGESVQVLSPYNCATEFSVQALNQRLRQEVNPLVAGMPVIRSDKLQFQEGDRVMITKNDRNRNCSNGDVGTLHILKLTKDELLYCVDLGDGRIPCWDSGDGLENLTLAYALTVHKSQGSEYDTVLLPVTMEMSKMLNRNLFYTAISRAKKQVILYGNMQAVDIAMQKEPLPRRSMLVSKANMVALRSVS